MEKAELEIKAKWLIWKANTWKSYTHNENSPTGEQLRSLFESIEQALFR